MSGPKLPFDCQCDGLFEDERPCEVCKFNEQLTRLSIPAPRTGRTEKMLRAVADVVKDGRKCVIVATNEDNIRDMKSRLGRMLGDHKAYDSVIFAKPDQDRIDMRSGKYIGTTYDVFADHSVLENRYWWLFEQWKKWNSRG